MDKVKQIDKLIHEKERLIIKERETVFRLINCLDLKLIKKEV